MATIEKVEKTGYGFLGPNQFELTLSCGHKFKTDQQPKVHVGDDFKCPACGTIFI